MSNEQKSVASKYDEEDLTGLDGQESRTFGSAGFPRVYFVSQHADYNDTPLQNGGFFVDAGDERVKMDGWGTVFEKDRGDGLQSVRGDRALAAVILTITPATRRLIVDHPSKPGRVIGHVDIEPKYWRMSGGKNGRWHKAGPHSSIYLVPMAQTNQVYEMKVKGSNVVAASGLARLMYYAVELFSVARGRPRQSPLADFALGHLLFAGSWLKYPDRVNAETGKIESGGRTNLSIAWPGIDKPTAFEKQFVTTDDYGQKIDVDALWREVKANMPEGALNSRFVGTELYKQFADMKAELDQTLAATTRVCRSEAEVEGEIRRLLAESMTENAPALAAARAVAPDVPAAQPAAQPAAAAVLRDAETYVVWRDTFREAFKEDPDKAFVGLASKINTQLALRGLDNRLSDKPTYKEVVGLFGVLELHASINDNTPGSDGDVQF